MIHRLVMLFVLMAVPGLGTVAEEAETRTQRLVEDCTGETYEHDLQKYAGTVLCAGYLAGIIDAHRVMVQDYGNAPRFCMPNLNAPVEEAVGKLVHWFKGHPEEMRQGVSGSVFRALADIYPCG